MKMGILTADERKSLSSSVRGLRGFSSCPDEEDTVSLAGSEAVVESVRLPSMTAIWPRLHVSLTGRKRRMKDILVMWYWRSARRPSSRCLSCHDGY